MTNFHGARKTTGHQFDDAAAYECFMAQWSRAIGADFLDWLMPPAGARWLDIGCGTGAFTELVLNRCSPAAVCAVDPAKAQIDHACRLAVGRQADFRIADAEELPFADATFDVVASALVINFIFDRPRALAEMRRVARPDGLVAGYVWDFAAERGVMSPLRLGMRRIGVDIPPFPGAEESSLDALNSLFGRAGLQRISTKAIDVIVTYTNFDDFWRAQTPSFNPLSKIIAALKHADRTRLIESVRTALPISSDGSVAYSARANAIMGRVPL